MEQNGPLFLYSKSKKREIRTGEYDLFLKGSPVLLNHTKSSETWLAEIIKQLESNNKITDINLVKELNNTSGLFSLIVSSGDNYILSSDVIRSYPLFYGYHKNNLFITDNLEEFQKAKGRLEIDYSILEEFITSGLVFGNRTVYKNVFGLQAGEIVTINSNEISSVRYYEFKPANKSFHYNSIIDFTRDFDKVFLYVFSRMIEHNPEVKRWVIPLSGGHDSRLIVNYLYRLGVKNVICFSYGTPENVQSQISKQVAEAVGFEWHFVEYTEQKWGVLHETGLFDEYIYYASNSVSTPHMQDFLAVHELKTKGIIGDGDIILPGHTAVTDTVFNESTLKLKTKEDAIQYVYNKNRILTSAPQHNCSVYSALQNMYSEAMTSPEHFMAYCDWQERQSKFITNSIKTYEFLGFESRQPMWDREMIEFWMRIPAEERVGREPLFITENMGGLVENLKSIPFAGENKKSIRLSFSKILKKLLPASVIALILRISRSKVVLNEGLNQIYTQKARSVEKLIAPIEDFPETFLPSFQDYLDRFPYQMDYNVLTTLYTIRKILDRNLDY